MNKIGSNKYSVEISMDLDTLTILKEKDYLLYAFRAVNAPGGSLPVVWQKISKYSLTTTVDWTVSYGAYFSSSIVQPGVKIKTTSKAEMDLGYSYVMSQKGVPSVKKSAPGTERSITITNHESDTLTCGICEVVDTAFRPLCASTVLNGFSDIIEPLQKVVLLFAHENEETSTIIQLSIGPGILLDLTTNPKRTASFTMVGGTEATWTSDKAEGQYTTFDSNSDLSPLLINPDSAPKAE